MTNDLPMMDEETMIGIGVHPEHPYFKEIQCLLSMSFILDITGKALIGAPKRSDYTDGACCQALDDYIETLEAISRDIYESRK